MATQQEKLQELLQATANQKAEIERTVYYDDFIKAFKSLMQYVERARQSLHDTADQNSKELDTKLEQSISKVDQMHKELEKKHAEVVSSMQSDQRTFQRMISEQMTLFGDSIPEDYDDAELREALSTLQQSFNGLEIPKEFDATELTAQVEKNERDIEELKKRPTGTGGGVTNARIQQAFKYILKTEAPSGDINGSNKVYTVSQPIFAVLAFSLNGEVIAELPNYTVSGNKITFSTALPAAYSGKDFEMKYV